MTSAETSTALAWLLLGLFVAAALAAVGALVALGMWLGGQSGWLCYGLAAAMAWAVLPRQTSISVGGLEITPHGQPELFEVLRQVAGAAGQPMPTQVRLVGDVQAFVAEHGAVLGLGGRRLMVLGIPLLRALDVGELRAILAHEMGHFCAGDVGGGVWLYQARFSMIRTLEVLGGSGERPLVTALLWPLRLPFRLLAAGFLRATQASSRAQELAADALAVRLEGEAAFVGGLQKVTTTRAAHAQYFQREIAPLLERGVVPPLGEGFSHYLRSDEPAGPAQTMSRALTAEGEAPTGPYDSHPSLGERVAAAKRIGQLAQLRQLGPLAQLGQLGPLGQIMTTPSDSSPERPAPPTSHRRGAVELVRDAESFETGLWTRLTQLRPVGWQEAGAVWIEVWRQRAAELTTAGVSLTAATVPHTAFELRVLLRKTGSRPTDDDSARALGHDLLGAALAVAACDAGFAADYVPGTALRLRRGAACFEPFRELRRYLAAETPEALWRARCEELGIAALPLGADPSSHPPQPQLSEGARRGGGGSLTTFRRSY